MATYRLPVSSPFVELIDGYREFVPYLSRETTHLTALAMIGLPTTGRWVVCAAKANSGVKHRFVMISAIKHFADQAGYSVCVLWGKTRGVAFCRYEELFAAIPGVRIVNISPEENEILSKCEASGSPARIGTETLPILRERAKYDRPPDRFFSWDLAGCFVVAAMAMGRRTVLVARPSKSISQRAETYMQKHNMHDRVGIRVRVEEYIGRTRRPHRIQHELDATIRAIIQLPWHLKVFVVTDSEYIQDMLSSHFPDTVYMRKNFDLCEPTGRYIHRLDRAAMSVFLEEITCLAQCHSVVNIGGYLNDHAVREHALPVPFV